MDRVKSMKVIGSPTKQLSRDVGTNPQLVQETTESWAWFWSVSSVFYLASSEQNYLSCPLFLESHWPVLGYNSFPATLPAMPCNLCPQRQLSGTYKKAKARIGTAQQGFQVLSFTLTPTCRWNNNSKTRKPIKQQINKQQKQWFGFTHCHCPSSTWLLSHSQLPDQGKSYLFPMSSSCVTTAPTTQLVLVWAAVTIVRVISSMLGTEVWVERSYDHNEMRRSSVWALYLWEHWRHQHVAESK